MAHSVELDQSGKIEATNEDTIPQTVPVVVAPPEPPAPAKRKGGRPKKQT